jgi:hypothetical protein
VNSLEDRLRDAYHRAAETVRPEHIPAPRWAREQANRREPPARRLSARPAWRKLTPVAAAVAVAVIAVSSAIVLPRVLGGTKATPAPSTPVSSTAVPSTPTGPPPKFMVVAPDVTGTPGAYRAAPLQVQDAATGRVVSTVRAPQAGTAWAIVTAVTSNTFILAAEPEDGACYTLLYKLKLTAAGAQASLTPLDVPRVSGYVPPNALVASADGTVAYASEQCPSTIEDAMKIAVIDTATARTTQWTVPVARFTGGGLALSADGKVLALGFGNNNYVPVSPPHTESPPYFAPSVWLLRTDSLPGPVMQRARRVVTLSGESQLSGAVLISADGSTVYTVTDYAQTAQQGATKVAAYDVATGALLRVVRTGWHLLVTEISADPGVDHAVLWGSGITEPVEIDLATGQVQTPKASLPHGYSTVGAAW